MKKIKHGKIRTTRLATYRGQVAAAVHRAVVASAGRDDRWRAVPVLLAASALFAPALVLAQSDSLDAADQSSAPATAAATATANPELEEVSVSASRIQVAGYEAPTPVTVVGLPTLERDAYADIGEQVRELPSFGTSPSPDNTGRSTFISDDSAGLDQVELRQLGAVRTLVLFNGQRVLNSNLANPGVDLSTIPQSLIERIDVVTGGASAAWGSDALAGVVNLILNTKFDGLKVNLEAGNNQYLEMADQKAEITYGTGFANDRGHVLVSGAYEDSPDTFFGTSIEGDQFQRLVTNPAYAPGNGQPTEILANNVGLAQATPGGIITGGPLKGTYFVGPNATPLAFNYGNVSNGSLTNGGTNNDGLAQNDFGEITNPFTKETLFGYASYNLTDNITASLQLNHGFIGLLGNSWTAVQYASLTVYSGNPFIPAATQALMTANGIKSFPFGTTLTGDVTGNGGNIGAEEQMVGMPVVNIRRSLNRGVVSLDGKMAVFGQPWTWTAYYEVGEVNTFSDPVNNPQTQPIINAVNAVTVGNYSASAAAGYTAAAYPNPLGIPTGTITCLSNLLPVGAKGETNNCAPLDAFGTGNNESAAAAYINGVARSGGDDSTSILKQDVISGSTSGELPIGFPAGNISTAFGGEFRRDFGYIKSTAAAQALTFYVTGNTLPFYGADNVEEGFLEFNAPILKNQGVQSLNIDVAGRYTDYSISGTVETYKLGVLSQVNDLIRLRASLSRDIRAPWLYELFNRGQTIGSTAIDPHTGTGVEVFNVTEGNTHLTPELGRTGTVGIVLTPVPDLQFSVDWWRIRVSNAITSAGAGTIDLECREGVQAYCNDLVFNGPNGALSEILVSPVNAALMWNSGYDISGDYHTRVLGGTMSLHFVGTYMYQELLYSLGVSNNTVGASVPRFKGTLPVTYSQDNWQITAQSRIIGSAKISNLWVTPNSTGNPIVNDNNIPAVYYLDLRGSVTVNNRYQIYAAIDNALDKRPPVIGSDSTLGGVSEYAAPFRDQIMTSLGEYGVWASARVYSYIRDARYKRCRKGQSELSNFYTRS